MAVRKKTGVNQSAFVRGVLEKNASATAKDVQEKWKAAGHESALNPAIYYNVRSKIGLGGRRSKRRGRPRKSAATAPMDASDGYLAIEQKLDQLLRQAVEMRDARLADALRDARRRASAKLV